MEATSRIQKKPFKCKVSSHFIISETAAYDSIPWIPCLRFIMAFLVFVGFSVWNTQSALAEFEVLDVALASTVQNREPVDTFSPPAYCEKDKNGQPAIPIIDSAKVQKIYLWTRVASTVGEMVRHSWHHQSDTGWEIIADVDLNISPSAGYRMWSSKKIVPAYHLGQWMIVVSPTKDPSQVLCIARFTVE